MAFRRSQQKKSPTGNRAKKPGAKTVAAPKASPDEQAETLPRPKAPFARNQPAPLSFADALRPLITSSLPRTDLEPLHSSPLAHLEYAAELATKNQGLALFWKHHRLAGKPEATIASPRARGYRTTSKRRGLLHGSTLYLLFGDKAALPKKGQPFEPSPLEPGEHAALFAFLQKKLSEATYRLVAGHLNYLIIRGSYAEQAIIFNVDMLNGPLVRKLKMLAEHLRKLPHPPAAAFVYLDPSKSDYYLESSRPAETLHFKKLFGPDKLAVSFAGCRYLFHPTSFSQINESMVEPMLEKAGELLVPAANENLLDLYCGYGLFSHFLAPGYRQVLAIDGEGPSIRAAEENSRLNRARGGKIKFMARRITAAMLERELPPPTGPEALLLDPPRQGPLPGVIKELAGREPRKALHIFCGVDQIPQSLKEWQKGGYRPERIVPLDMFPGSANLEVLILLARNAEGKAG
ncbi:class I SAM-dependent RNA methyltransferase [Thiovibrio sp. JS02]